MIDEKYCLILETLRFLELCQLNLKNGRIDLEDYFEIVKIKFKFINYVLIEDRTFLRDYNEIGNFLNRVLNNHYNEALRCPSPL